MKKTAIALALLSPSVWAAPGVAVWEDYNIPSQGNINDTVTLSWNMWWGDKAQHWKLLENGKAVYQSNFADSVGNGAQSGSIEWQLQQSGSINYQVQLCDENGCSQSTAVTISVAGGVSPTLAPTVEPTIAPTVTPTVAPTVAPTIAPTVTPTIVPTVAPTEAPTVAPTITPSVEPTPPVEQKTSRIVTQDGGYQDCISATEDPNAPLVMKTCQPTPYNSWVVTPNGLLNEAHQLCIQAPTSWGNARLGVCNASEFAFDEYGSYTNGKLALDRARSGDVLFYQVNFGINQQWWLDEDVHKLAAAGGEVTLPFPSSDYAKYETLQLQTLSNYMTPVSLPLPFPKDVSQFPGETTAQPELTTVNAQFTPTSDVVDHLMVVPKGWHATGLYAPAGGVLEITLDENISKDVLDSLNLIVNSHTDALQPTSGNVKNKDFRRHPKVSENFNLQPGVNQIRSQFGGHIVLQSEQVSTAIEMSISGAIKAPHFVLGKTTPAQWLDIRDNGAPWTIFEGEKTVVVARSSNARLLSDPTELVTSYDHVVSLLNDLAGYDIDPVYQAPIGKQWIVEDPQIVAGSAHAGFPVMVDSRLHDLTKLETANGWMNWHELGHNYQQKKQWGNIYNVEVTVNLFANYAKFMIEGRDRLADENRYETAKAEIDAGQTYAQVGLFSKLVFFFEIKNFYPDTGWDLFRQIHLQTRLLSTAQKDALAASKQKQWDHVYLTFSDILQVDLRPHFERWSVPISNSAFNAIAAKGYPLSPADLSGL